MKLFRQIAIRSNVAVERFFLPHAPACFLKFVNLVCSEGFYRLHQFRHRPKHRVITSCRIPWAMAAGERGRGLALRRQHTVRNVCRENAGLH